MEFPSGRDAVRMARRAVWPWGRDVKGALHAVLPPTTWLASYSPREQLWRDVLAGLTCGVTVLPQGMAYAGIVGLPPVYGLYCALIPPLGYFAFGSSPHLIVGPTAVMSLMVGAAAAALNSPGANPDATTLPQLAALISFEAGIVFCALAVCRAGFVANFLSHAVISGFTSAAGLIIGVKQMRELFGLSAAHSVHPHSSVFWEIAYDVVANITSINWWATGVGLVSCAFIMGLRFVPQAKLVPTALLVIVGGILVSWLAHLPGKGVHILGHVDPGFPVPMVPLGLTDPGLVLAVAPTGVLIALIGFMEAFSIGRLFSIKGGYELNANQELFGLGMSNVLGAFFQAYPATGSFSRTAVNERVGATSGIANLVSALLVLVTCLWLTPLFYYLPKACLSAIIVTAVINLFDHAEVRFLWRTKPRDLLVWMVAFIGTLFLGIEAGILLGLGSSVGLAVWRMSLPTTEIHAGAPANLARLAAAVSSSSSSSPPPPPPSSSSPPHVLPPSLAGPPVGAGAAVAAEDDDDGHVAAAAAAGHDSHGAGIGLVQDGGAVSGGAGDGTDLRRRLAAALRDAHAAREALAVLERQRQGSVGVSPSPPPSSLSSSSAAAAASAAAGDSSASDDALLADVGVRLRRDTAARLAARTPPTRAEARRQRWLRRLADASLDESLCWVTVRQSHLFMNSGVIKDTLLSAARGVAPDALLVENDVVNDDAGVRVRVAHDGDDVDSAMASAAARHRAGTAASRRATASDAGSALGATAAAAAEDGSAVATGAPLTRPAVVILDMSYSNDVDGTALHTLSDAQGALRQNRVRMVVAGASRDAERALHASGFTKRSRVFADPLDALAHARGLARRRQERRDVRRRLRLQQIQAGDDGLGGGVEDYDSSGSSSGSAGTSSSYSSASSCSSSSSGSSSSSSCSSSSEFSADSDASAARSPRRRSRAQRSRPRRSRRPSAGPTAMTGYVANDVGVGRGADGVADGDERTSLLHG